MIINEILDKRISQLDKNVFFCTECVNSNQRFGLTFDEHGVCDACRYAREKQSLIDWEKREQELQHLCDRFRSKDGSIDCIVPASGGKDSCYVAHQLKYQYGMHPLTVTWAPAMFTDIGWKNFQNMVKLFDNMMAHPNRRLHGKLARLGFELWGDIFAPWHYGQRAFPLHMALNYKIPLVFYGEKTNVEYGGRRDGKESPLESDTDRQHIKKTNAFDQIVAIGKKYGILAGDDIHERTFEMYQMPPEDILERAGIEVHWFSYYKKWVPQENYYYAREHCGFEPNSERSEGTYSKYASLDDKTDGIHYYLQLIKIGIGRCTSDAAQEIRSGHITREEGVALVRRYDSEFPKKYFHESLEYMGIPEQYFYQVIDKFRPPHLWERVGDEWHLRHQVR